MLNFLKKLEPSLFTVLVVGFISILGFAITSFLIPTNYIDIPLGIILSGAVVCLSYSLTYFALKIDEKKQTHIFSIITLSIRLTISLLTLLMMVLMYYRWNIKLFNVFTFVGVYTVGTVCFALASSKRKE